ncbi:hypothetical protein GOP47_0019750 [Adiantum capillus-veneris]|uniref:Protein ENHANCED DISEASE RESISTANCE 2 C-terminal domain-containing protein n=1 Tax=Adiantum capillus-veneris TaxID=13818 RepID=A0A9D4UC45_ADICA|nr:hypothetical protein GOP47_0019750 [Adiantum capillus-veneris]
MAEAGEGEPAWIQSLKHGGAVPPRDFDACVNGWSSPPGDIFQPMKDSLLQRFLDGDNAFRNARFKLLANVVQGPWIVKTAVGERAVCLLGKAVTWQTQSELPERILGTIRFANLDPACASSLDSPLCDKDKVRPNKFWRSVSNLLHAGYRESVANVEEEDERASH